MSRFSSVLVGTALAVALLALANQTGLPRALGAHPFWATQVLWIGAPLGLALVLPGLLRARPGRAVLAGLALSAAAFGAATHGRIAFAASYAEDALAGQLWYFGWIALAAGVALTLAPLPALLIPHRPARA